MAPAVRRITRQAIIDELRAEGLNWAGGLEDAEFLEAIWDLEDLPSHDARFPNAAGDIWQHRTNNDDWDSDWIFSDTRFDLLHCDDDKFLGFLTRMVDPVVRRDPDEAERLVRFFNECLGSDHLEFVAVRRQPTLRGQPRPIYAVQQKARGRVRLDLPRFDRLAEPAALEEHLGRIDTGIEVDPALAIGSAKELLESLFRQILDDYGDDSAATHDVLDLYKRVAQVLKLNAESVPASARGSEAAQRALRALVTTVQSLAELRNELGLGHGRRTTSPALGRHARLAATAARGVSEFVLETWHVRRAREEPASLVSAKEAGQGPSAEPGRTNKFREGDRVTHPMFGAGVVRRSTMTRSDEELVVAFERAGVKILSGTLAPLTVIP